MRLSFLPALVIASVAFGSTASTTPEVTAGSLESKPQPVQVQPQLQPEEITLPTDSIQIIQVDSAMVPAFVLGANTADFLTEGHRQASVSLGSRDEIVYGGKTSFWRDDAGTRHFSYSDPQEPVKLTVQGHPFSVGPGSGVTALKDPNGSWVFTTVGKNAMMRDPDKAVTSVEVHSKAPTAVSPVFPGTKGPSWAPHSAGSESRTVRDEISRNLYNLPVYKFRYAATPLTQVFSLLARQCGITFFASASGDSDAPKDILINARGEENPFLLMELIAAENGYSVELISSSEANPRGTWTIRSFEREGLVGRAYYIKFNDREVQSTSSGAAAPAAQQSGAAGGVPNVSIAPAANVFNDDAGAQLQKEVQGLLDITDPGVLVDGDTDYEKPSSLLDSGIKIPALSTHKQVQGLKGKVLYSSDARTLYVIATRQQHEWVRGYLRAFDRPVRNIALEVKFVETLRSPSNNYGIQWPTTVHMGAQSVAGTGKNGNGSWLSVGTTASPTTSSTSSSSSSGTASSSLPTGAGGPFGAILSASDLSFVLSALNSDSKDTTIKYFYTAVNENREAVLSNTSQIPILAAQSSASTGGAATSQQQSSIQYLPIGTTLNLHASVAAYDQVHLNIQLMISTISGYDVIQNNSYPVAATRNYHGPVTVGSGDSIAIGGLDEFDATDSSSGVPGLANIPVLGYLFKNTQMSRTHSHLIIFVTPHVLEGVDSGVESIERGTSLGRTHREGYLLGSSRSMSDLRKAADGLTGMINDLGALREEGELSSIYLPDVNGLYADVLAMTADFHRLVPQGGDKDDIRFFLNLQTDEHRLSELYDYLKAKVDADRAARKS